MGDLKDAGIASVSKGDVSSYRAPWIFSREVTVHRLIATPVCIRNWKGWLWGLWGQKWRRLFEESVGKWHTIYGLVTHALRNQSIMHIQNCSLESRSQGRWWNCPYRLHSYFEELLKADPTAKTLNFYGSILLKGDLLINCTPPNLTGTQVVNQREVGKCAGICSI